MEIVVKNPCRRTYQAFYQTAGASLLLAALVMCVYMLDGSREPVRWFGHGSGISRQVPGSDGISSWHFMLE